MNDYLDPRAIARRFPPPARRVAADEHGDIEAEAAAALEAIDPGTMGEPRPAIYVDFAEPEAEPESEPESEPEAEPEAEPGDTPVYVTRHAVEPVAAVPRGKSPRLPKAAIYAAAVVAVCALAAGVAVLLASGPEPAAEPPRTPAQEPESTAPAAVHAAGTEFAWYGDRLTMQALTFPGIVIGTPGSTYDMHAHADRTAAETVDDIVAAQLAGELPDVVVFAYGTVDDVDQTTIDMLVRSTADRGVPLVLVGPGAAIHDDLPWAGRVNERYAAAAATPGVFFVDWQAAVDDNPSTVESTPGETMVLTGPGAVAWTNQVNLTLKTIFDDIPPTHPTTSPAR